MQDKDFDRFMQQAFEHQPEPEYNPADWDKLEDRLHNLNVSQPNAGGASAGAGLGKLGLVASAVLVTAFNVVFFSKPELFKNATNSTEKVAVVAQNTQPENSVQEIPADKTLAAVSALKETTATVNEIEISQTETEQIVNELPAVVTKNAANNIAVIKPAVATPKQRTVAKPARKNNPATTTHWAWPAVAANRPGVNAGNHGFSAGNPAATVQPCNLTFKPEIATILIGKDTLRGTRLSVTSCQLLEARIFTKGEIADKVTLTSNVANVLPGARLITEPVTKATILQWQPNPEMVRQQPYNFMLWVSDDRCPDAAPRAYQFALQVSPAFTVAINGVTRINKGQETTLEVKGAPAGSTYQWLTGNKIILENEIGRLVAAPAKSTTYRVLVSSPNGCVFTDTVNVEVTTDDLLATSKAVPNIFTPNNDGLNDYFEIQLPEEGPYSLEVFDRDSKLVFAQDKYDNRWNAPKLASGTYYYIITTPREKKTYKGWVEIMR